MTSAANAKLPWYRSLRFKLVATAIAVEILMLSLLLFNSYRLVGEALETQTHTRLQALGPLLNASLAGLVFQRDHSEINTILQELLRSELSGIRYIVVIDAENRLLAQAGDAAAHLPPAPANNDRSVAAALADLSYDTQIPLTLAGTTQVGTVRFGLSLATLASLRDNVLRQSLLIAGGEILLSLLLLVSLGYLLTHHIASLLAGTRRVASADYSVPIDIVSRDEIGELAHDFNIMTAVVRERMAQLEESESRFRTIFDAAGDAIFIHDAADGRLLDVNQRMCEMYRCTHANALNATVATFSANVAPFDMEHAAEKLRLARTKGPQTFDWLARRFDGEEFWVEVNLRHTRIGSMERIVAVVRDISERKRHQQELEYLAHHDQLTQLPNRVLLDDRLHQAIAQTWRTQRLLAVAYLDLDGFKPVNDTLGHEIGDRLLCKVAQRLKLSVRAGDSICRLGGDEFALLLGDLANIDEASLALDRLLNSLAAPYLIEQQVIQISASIGVTIYPFDDADPETLLRHADQAMYTAKQGGRNRFHLFDADQDRLVQVRHSTKARIIAALDNNEFVMHYQPQVDMRSGTVIGAEALIRWQHAEEGLVPPGQFLPIIEDSSFIVPLSEWIIGTVLAQMARWQQAGLQLKVCVNIAARHLQLADFSTRLARLLAARPEVSPAMLELEIVESSAFEDMAHVARVIDECHALGVSFALDDFGTGYSSLSYFKRLRIDRVKVDQSFVRGMLDDAEDHAIVEGVISLTHSFKRQVIAEGVETVELGSALIAMGCPLAQGFVIARPMPANELPDWIERWRPDPAWQQ